MKLKKGILLIFIVFFLLKSNLRENVVGVTENQNHDPILFLHGVTRSNSDWWSFRLWFQQDGWVNTTLYAYTFDDVYNASVQAITNNALKIQEWVNNILNETSSDKIDLVAHSMGGQSGRYYVKFLDGIDTVDDYVSLGTAHHGIPNNTWGEAGINAFATSLNEGDETPGGILQNDSLGVRQDPVWDNLSYTGAHIPGKINYTSIYSRDEDPLAYLSNPLDGAYNIELEGITHDGLIASELVYNLTRLAVDDTLDGKITTTTTIDTTNSTSSRSITSSVPTTSFLFPSVFSIGVMTIISRRCKLKKK